MAIDKGDWHFDDAKSWERACRHIGLYLAWAAQRGFASNEHDAKAAAKAPTAYFIGQCDTKLWDEDFNADGLKLTQDVYSAYCDEVSRYARQLGVGDYEIPDTAKTAKHFFGWLDERLATWRGKPAPRTPAKGSKASEKAQAKKAQAKKAKAAKPRAKTARKARPKAGRAKR
jgi:hypothetical protein